MHPHTSSDEIAVVHNGIIENHHTLRDRLIEHGYGFYSQTDSEVCAHLIHYFYQENKDLLKSVQLAVAEMERRFCFGNCASR